MAGVIAVEIPYKPRNWARPFHASFKRWAVLVMHRRAGKTTGLLNHHQRAATNNKWEAARLRYLEPSFTDRDIKELLRERKYGHILPLLKQAKSVAWGPLKYISRDIPGAKPNETDLSITYPNGSVVRLFGADNPDSFRGMPFSGVSYDEYSQHPPSIHGEVVSKALADHLGYGIFAGTIKGKNQLYRAYEAAKTHADWFALWQDVDVSLATEEGATITAIRRAMQDDLEQIKMGLMTQEEYDQEWFLSPTAAIKGAYYGKLLAAAIREKRVGFVPYDPALKVHDVWDLGKGQNMAVGLFQRFGREVRKIDFLQGNASDGIPDLIRELQRKPYVYGKHLAPHDIAATDLSTGKTRAATAKALGWEFTTVPDIGLDDGINAGKLMFPRLWIDEQKCEAFLDAIGQYKEHWDEKRGVFTGVPEHNWASHPADMYRYAAVAEELMTNDKPRTPAKAQQPHMGGTGWMA
jgi:phage terminase large subunit